MKTSRWIILLALLASACGGDGITKSDPLDNAPPSDQALTDPSSGGANAPVTRKPVEDYASLIDYLSTVQDGVTYDGIVVQLYMTVEGRRVTVGGEQVHVRYTRAGSYPSVQPSSLLTHSLTL